MSSRPCGHSNKTPTSVDVVETETTIITETKCQCGQSLSTTRTPKIKPSQPGTGGEEPPRRNR
jgi:hypothetical protein